MLPIGFAGKRCPLCNGVAELLMDRDILICEHEHIITGVEMELALRENRLPRPEGYREVPSGER